MTEEQKKKLTEAMDVINESQQRLWQISHVVRGTNETFGIKIWEESLQLEHALLRLNEDLLGGSSYYEPEEK